MSIQSSLRTAVLGHVGGRPQLSPRVLPFTTVTHFYMGYYSFYRPRKDERLSRPCWLAYSRRFTNISGHPSAVGRALDRDSSPVETDVLPAVPRSQPTRKQDTRKIRIDIIGFGAMSNRCRHLANKFTSFTTQTTADAIADTISR